MCADHSAAVVPGDRFRTRIYCRFCRHETNHEILWSEVRHYSDEDISQALASRLMKCRGCDDVTLEQSSSSDQDYDRYGNPEVSIQHYPPRVPAVDFLDYDRSQYLPYSVTQLYEEVTSAFSAGAFTLTAIGVRALVEAVCKAEGASGKDLERRIDSLTTTGIVSVEQAKFLHILRRYGNDGAHDARPPSIAEVRSLVDIVNQMLRTTYRMPWAAARLKP